MQVYLVGGAVRDKLMGKIPSDADYVVVGATQQQMLDNGFQQVGKDFPVFLNSQGDEFALARTERSTGNGYGDFTFSTENITLEQDLMRRDLTINAIAMQDTDSYVDPYGGINDIKNKILRCVNSESFVEDPLRVLRLARFCAKYPDFDVDKDTLKLCQKMVDDGMLDHLTAERMGAELVKTLQTTTQPSRFFYFLKMCGALKIVMPELDRLADVVAGNFVHHPEGDTFNHTMQVLDQLDEIHFFKDPLARFAAVVHDLGKGTTPEHILPHHYGHEDRGVPLVDAVCDRLKLSNDYRQIGKWVAKYHTHIHNFHKLNPKTIVKLFDDLRCDQDLNNILILTLVSEADSRGRTSFYANRPYLNVGKAIDAAVAYNQVKARNICTEEQLKLGKVVGEIVYKARVAAVATVMKGRE